MAIREKDARGTGYGRQWHVDGFKNNVYTVSMRRSSTSAHSFEAWSCACKNWTQNSPRQDCKHILQVKLMLLQPQPAGCKFCRDTENWNSTETIDGKKVHAPKWYTWTNHDLVECTAYRWEDSVPVRRIRVRKDS